MTIKSRVVITRVSYRDPAVLFFDEATSALDSQTEEAVNEAIRDHSGHKTIGVIAHRQVLDSHQQIMELEPTNCASDHNA